MPEAGEVEVFDAICHGLLEAPEARQHVLVWGSRPATAASKADHAWRLCEQDIERQVDGVFFAPIELTAAKDAVNRRIADALDAARIPVVLIDRAIEPFPHRGRHDLVGLDNRRAGALVTEHLLSVGCARPCFWGCPTRLPASTGAKRDFVKPCARLDSTGSVARTWREDPADRLRLAALLVRDSPDSIVCASDRTAAVLMHALRALGRRVP